MSTPARKAAGDFSKTACIRETRALCTVMEALGALDAEGRAFVLETAARRLGINAPPAAKAKAIDKTHWYSEKEPFGPRNLDC